MDLKGGREPESVRGELKAKNSQEPGALLCRSEVRGQNDFPGHGDACGYRTGRAERKDTIRRGASAVLAWETIKASE